MLHVVLCLIILSYLSHTCGNDQKTPVDGRTSESLKSDKQNVSDLTSWFPIGSMTVDNKVSLAPDLYLNLSATLNVLQQDVLNPHIWFL